MSHILPKKSWNVYNEDNKEKVRHDEEAARIQKELGEVKVQQAVWLYDVTLFRDEKRN
jgi:hypothetical protein